MCARRCYKVQKLTVSEIAERRRCTFLRVQARPRACVAPSTKPYSIAFFVYFVFVSGILTAPRRENGYLSLRTRSLSLPPPTPRRVQKQTRTRHASSYSRERSCAPTATKPRDTRRRLMFKYIRTQSARVLRSKSDLSPCLRAHRTRVHVYNTYRNARARYFGIHARFPVGRQTSETARKTAGELR